MSSRSEIRFLYVCLHVSFPSQLEPVVGHSSCLLGHIQYFEGGPMMVQRRRRWTIQKVTSSTCSPSFFGWFYWFLPFLLSSPDRPPLFCPVPVLSHVKPNNKHTWCSSSSSSWTHNPPAHEMRRTFPVVEYCCYLSKQDTRKVTSSPVLQPPSSSSEECTLLLDCLSGSLSPELGGVPKLLWRRRWRLKRWAEFNS